MRLAALAASLLLTAATPAFAAWSEARTKHFIIYSEQRPADLKAYAERLERFDAAVRAIRRIDDPPLTDGGKVTIYVLASVKDVQRLASGGRTSGGDFGILGFYIGRAEGSVAFFSSKGFPGRETIKPEHVFQHEYMHHLMLSEQSTPLAPWLTEGGAEFFGTAEVARDGTVVIGNPPQARGNAVLSDDGFNVEQLVGSKLAKSAEERESVYGKGWVLSHFFAFNTARKGQLERYLNMMGKGSPPLEAARASFGDLKKLDAEIDRYARGRFQALSISPGPAPVVTVRTLTPGQSAIMETRIQSERGVNKSSAPGIAAAARRHAAAHPNDPFIQGVLAEAEFDVKDYAATIAAADRGLAVDPNNVQALVYRGRAMLEQAKAEPAKANWTEIRRWFGRANRADVENGEPLWLYYQTFAAAGQAPTKQAVEGLLYAQALVPQDSSLRGEAVRQLLRDNKPELAEPMFVPLAFNPHLTLALQPIMSSILERIRARDAKGALAIMDAEEAKAKKRAEGA